MFKGHSMSVRKTVRLVCWPRGEVWEGGGGRLLQKVEMKKWLRTGAAWPSEYSGARKRHNTVKWGGSTY